MTTDEIKQKVIDYAYGYGIDPAVALAQAQRESGFNPNAVGADGERGLMQFMPATWSRFSNVGFDQAFDIDYNLTAWGNYMSYLSGLFGGDLARMLTAYNGGEGHILNPGQYGPPSASALAYSSGILANANYTQDYSVAAVPSPMSNTVAYFAVGAAVLIGLLVLRG